MRIDILIKSFNRPYYLERCLFSIYKFVTETDFTITILDDGTPQKYLNLLSKKYPLINLLKSENYNLKVPYTTQGKQPVNHKVPINLWVNAAKNASDYFLLLEDDIWFTSSINLGEIVKKTAIKNSLLTKLFWLGNPNLIQATQETTFKNLTYLTPDLQTQNPLLYRFFFTIDRFKIRKTLKLLTVYSPKKELSYYSIYSVAGVVFEKKYFLSLWNNHKNSVNESLQIYNALKYLKKNNTNTCFARTHNEYLKTGFMSAATNKDYFNNPCDLFQLNHILNELWYQNQLEVIENFPNDFNLNYLKKLINDSDYSFNTNQWIKWVNEFQERNRNYGCKID